MSGVAPPPTPRQRRQAAVVFDRPELQGRGQRWAYSLLTLVAWVVWVYLWLPLVTLVAWYLGFRTFLREIVIPDPLTMVTVGVVYLGIVLVLGGLLVVWSRYNLARFRGKDRRKAGELVGNEEVRATFGLSPADLHTFRQGTSLVVRHRADGRILGVEAGSRIGGIVAERVPVAASEAEVPGD